MKEETQVKEMKEEKCGKCCYDRKEEDKVNECENFCTEENECNHEIITCYTHNKLGINL